MLQKMKVSEDVEEDYVSKQKETLALGSSLQKPVTRDLCSLEIVLHKRSWKKFLYIVRREVVKPMLAAESYGLYELMHTWDR